MSIQTGPGRTPRPCVNLPCLALGIMAASAVALNASGPLESEWGAVAARYREPVDRIVQTVREKNEAYPLLAELCDDVGHRLSGSENLDRAVEWGVRTLRKAGLENVRAEPVQVPRWVRGNESAELVEPRRRPLAMLGLGGSVGTPPAGITAEVLVVRDKDELDRRAKEAEGRIVLFNYPMRPYDPAKGSGYGDAVRYRGAGPDWAAGHGAVACLIRSVTARSLSSPHTGALHYGDKVKKIPGAALSIEDAESLARMAARGQRVVVNLKMEARDEGLAPSANVVGELRGRERPEEIVVVSGHLDSWDVGQGAHDDGAGCVLAIEAAAALKRMNLIPRRTIRVVLWTNEENGLAGAREYVRAHESELKLHAAAIEADSGGFRPEGFGVDAADERKLDRMEIQLREMLKLLAPLGATRVTRSWGGADISRMKPAGVPLLGLDVEGSTYFDYHHTHGDTLDKIDPRDLTESTAAMTALAYMLADMPGRLGDDPAASHADDMSTK